MSSSTAVGKKKAVAKQLSPEEIQAGYSRMQNELQGLAKKIGELESEAEEHELVLKTLEECAESEPNRKCFRLIGGVLVERTVTEVAPQIKTNREGIIKVLDTLVKQYKTREDDFQAFQKEHNIRVNRS